MSVTLRGLDGSNPLAFLAALGVLRILDDAAAKDGPPPRLRWRLEGRYVPTVDGVEEMVELIDVIARDQASWEDEPALALAYAKGGERVPTGTPRAVQDLKPRPSVMREFLDEVAVRAAGGSRRSADLAAAFGSDIAVDNNGNVKPTAFHFTAGNQAFLKMVNELRDGVSRSDLDEALNGEWRGLSELPSMSWDATASRLYAYRASDPAAEKRSSVAGANWLAIRALPFFPVAARGARHPLTPCFEGGWKDATFTWPIWTSGATASTVQSLLACSWRGGDGGLAAASPSERAARGVEVAFRSKVHRSEQGGYGSFSPAVIA